MKKINDDLLKAARTYGRCAQAVTANAAGPPQLSEAESEQVIGFGIAYDWNKRACSLRRVMYNRPGGPRNKSRRGAGVTELIRFNMSWYAMNALFSRGAILGLVGKPKSTKELDKFKLLYTHANIPLPRINMLTVAAHSILNRPTSTRIAGHAAGSSVTILSAIVKKYIPPDAMGFAAGKLIKGALTTGNLSALDLPTLIYLMRNWVIHGNLMDGAFGGIVSFESYIDLILTALTEIHVGVSEALLKSKRVVMAASPRASD